MLKRYGSYFLMATILVSVTVFPGCSGKEVVDVASFPTECLRKCAITFNKCSSWSLNGADTKLCEELFEKCKSECAAKDSTAVLK